MSLQDRLLSAVVVREVFDTGGTMARPECFDLAKLSHADVLACLRAEVQARLWASLSPASRARRQAALDARYARKQARLAERQARRAGEA